MATPVTNAPGTMADSAAVGVVAWSNVNNAKVDDSSYAVFSRDWQHPSAFYDNEVKLVLSSGSIGTENKAATTTMWVDGPEDEATTTYGGAADTWSESLLYSDVNHANFGVVLAVKNTEISHYLKATNFGFSIPATGVITGIAVGFKRYQYTPGQTREARVNYITMTVYYTDTSTSSSVSSSRSTSASSSVSSSVSPSTSVSSSPSTSPSSSVSLSPSTSVSSSPSSSVSPSTSVSSSPSSSPSSSASSSPSTSVSSSPSSSLSPSTSVSSSPSSSLSPSTSVSSSPSSSPSSSASPSPSNGYSPMEFTVKKLHISPFKKRSLARYGHALKRNGRVHKGRR